MESADLSEIKRQFGVVTESLRGEIRQVAEAVAAVDAKLEVFREEVAREYEETRAMTRLS